MPRAVFAVNDFVQFSNLELAPFGANVGSKLAGNANYPEPPVTPATIVGLANTLTSKIQAALNGGIVQTAELKVARLNLINALKETSRYVNTKTYNDPVAIESVGFNASPSEYQTPQIPAQPLVKATQGGEPGTANIAIKGQKGVRAYTAIIYADTPGAVVVTEGTGIRISGTTDAQVLTEVDGEMLVTGLTSMTRYMVVAFVVNAAGRSILSTPVAVVPM